MWRPKPLRAVTAPLDDSPAALPRPFRWLKPGLLICLLLWIAIVLAWLGMYRIADRRLAREIAAANGQPLYPNDFRRPPIADSDNAVWRLRPALNKFVEYSQAHPYSDELDEYPLTPAALDALALHIKANAEVLKVIRCARQCTGADWDSIPWRAATQAEPLLERLRVLYQIRELSDLCRHAAFLTLATGDEAQSIEYLLDGIALARIADEEPSLMGQVVSAGAESVVCAALRDMMSVPLRRDAASTRPASREQTAALAAELLEESDRIARTRRAYLAEHAALLSRLSSESAYSYTDRFGIIRDPMPAHAKLIRLILAPQARLRAVDTFRKLWEMVRANDISDWPSAKKFVPAVAVGPRSAFELPLAQWVRATRFQPWYTEFRYRINAARRLTPILLAIRLYQRDRGMLPHNLEQLVPDYLPMVPLDPFTSPPSSMRYVPDTKFPFIYSVFSNGADDVAAGYQPTSRDHNLWQAPDLILFIDPKAVKEAERQAATKPQGSGL